MPLKAYWAPFGPAHLGSYPAVHGPSQVSVDTLRDAMDGRLQGAAVGAEINRAVGGGNHQADEHPLVGRDGEPGGPGAVITDAIIPGVSQLAHTIYGCGGVTNFHAAIARTG